MSYIGNTPASNFASVTKDTFSGDGSTTAFTLSKAATTNGVAVFVENVRQEPTTAYAVSGTTLTFTAAPVSSSGNNIYVLHHNTPASTATHPAAQDLTAANGTFTSNIDVDGTANLDAVDIDGAVDMASTLAVAGVSSLTNKITVLAADGTVDNDWVMDVRNDEATNDRSYGLRVSAGSTSTDRALDILDHAQANTLFRVTGNGLVTKPQNPHFMGGVQSTVGSTSGYNEGTGQSMIANVAQDNTGSHYNTTTGDFTCPVTGVYQVNFHGFLHTNQSTSNYSIQIKLNASIMQYAYFAHVNGNNTYMSYSTAIKAAATNILTIKLMNGLWYAADWRYFGKSIYLLG